MKTTSHTRISVKYETRRGAAPAQLVRTTAGSGIFPKTEAGIVVTVGEAKSKAYVQWAKGIYIIAGGETDFHAPFYGPARPFSHAVLDEFAMGKEGNPPTDETYRLAQRIMRTAVEKGAHPDIHVDFEGSLSFDLRLPNGRLLLAYLFPDGVLDVSVYDDTTDEWVVNEPDAVESDFVGLF